MKTSPLSATRRVRGFTSVEIVISMSIAVLVLGLALGAFLFGLRAMYKDNVRLQTNADLRYFMAQMSKETLDSSEFYIFPSYRSLNGSVILATAVSALGTDVYGTDIAYGDCVVLVTRTAVTSDAAVRKFRIYYRVASVANRNNEAPIRFYESADYGTASPHFTTAQFEALLNAVNLDTTPGFAGSRNIAKRAKGRPIPGSGSYYPIFSSESPTTSSANESFSINVEFINGTTANNLLSSSSFNYTVSPRR